MARESAPPSKPDAPGTVTERLIAFRGGDRNALQDVFPIVYQQLRTIAHRRLGGGARGRTLDTTGLVHEAYLKLVGGAPVDIRDRGHFFAIASQAMRQILIDGARRRVAQKRGGPQPAEELVEDRVGVASHAEQLLALDEALSRLARTNERLARVVELRFFGGLSVEETAEVLGVTDRTVKRDWRLARAVLHCALDARDVP